MFVSNSLILYNFWLFPFNKLRIVLTDISVLLIHVLIKKWSMYLKIRLSWLDDTQNFLYHSARCIETCLASLVHCQVKKSLNQCLQDCVMGKMCKGLCRNLGILSKTPLKSRWKLYFSVYHHNLWLSFLITYREWDKEQYQAQNKGQKPSLGKALFRTFGKGYILLGIFALIIVSTLLYICKVVTIISKLYSFPSVIHWIKCQELEIMSAICNLFWNGRSD